MSKFTKAVKHKLNLRMAIQGPSGGGKTMTALKIARAMVGPEGRIAVIDTERGSARKYADIFEFDVVEPDSFSPESLVADIKDAEGAGFNLLIVDSMSHYWMGEGGMLDQVDRAAKRSQSGNSFAAWKDVAPKEKAAWAALLKANMHIIVTLRTKTEYVMEEAIKGGRKTLVPKKVGMAPIQRDGTEYEFDVVMDMNHDHDGIISKTRCAALCDGVFNKPGAEVANVLRGWLDGGEAKPQTQQSKNEEPAQDEAAQFEQNARDSCRARVAQASKALGLNKLLKRLLAQRTEADPAPMEILERYATDIEHLAAFVAAGPATAEQIRDLMEEAFIDGNDALNKAISVCEQCVRDAADAEAQS